jgi:hypothetical protein
MKLKKGIEKRISSLGKTLQFEGVANWISGGNARSRFNCSDSMKQIYKVLNQLPDNQKNCIYIKQNGWF